MTEEQAEVIAIAAIGWLCEQESLLPVFLSASGADVDTLRAALSAPAGPDTPLLVAALDFILLRDDTVLSAAQAQFLPPDRLIHAHAALSGASQMHWT